MHEELLPITITSSGDHVVVRSGEVTIADRFYDDPYPAVAEIKGHVAFYSDRVARSVQAAVGAED